ncbi:hypothetical protein AVEN_260819-1 [Araneus ventricosus]|uniref:DUF4817 domain-containing protein n=1 Tax=Araneus ventricosus TaxID=182803 RepID=A0A4Y2F5S7_ARAVE|nr:hypothetical protein AVEN_260819-1 [Araneus ventricosus]
MYSIEQRVFLVLEYHRLKESPTATRRSFQARFNVPKGPDAKTIRTLFAKFQRTGSVTDDLMGNVGRQQTAVTPENVATVSGIIQQTPMSSVHRIASETGLKRSSTQKILRKSLHMFPFKIQTHQAIPVRAVQQRVDFANQMLTMIDSEGFDVGCIWFTDEAHFHLNGIVNKQNWRFWGPKIHIGVKRNPCILLKLLCGLQYAAEALLALFSFEKRSLVNVTLQFWNNLSPHSKC